MTVVVTFSDLTWEFLSMWSVCLSLYHMLDIQILHVGVGVLFLPNRHIHPYGFMLDTLRLNSGISSMFRINHNHKDSEAVFVL